MNAFDQIFKFKKRKQTRTTKKGKSNSKKRAGAKRCKELPSIRTRTSPNKLFEAVSILMRWQRNVVRRMGLGKILNLKVSDINASLAYFVIDRLDTEKMEINLGDRQIKVDKEGIRRIMGVPYEGIRVVRDAEGCADAEKLVETWKNRFVKVPISCKNIINKIRENFYADEEMFKMDFAMLFIATMIASTKNGHAMYRMFGWFCLSKEFKEHDWCQLIMDTIRVCKSDWDRSDRDSFLRGPLIVLVLLYLDSTTCPRFGISFWTKDMMSMRKDLEIRNGGLDLVMLESCTLMTKSTNN
ncbi:hypothetical protein Hdeb2414_s0020g00559231 [Helianthus debilis subsp. tardiflorus]